MTIVASPRGRQNVLDSDVFCWNELPELLAADELFESSGLDVQRITETSLACASKQEDDEFEDEDDEDDDDEDDDDIDDDTRKILEMSNKTILLLLRRLIVQAHDAEYQEARR